MKIAWIALLIIALFAGASWLSSGPEERTDDGARQVFGLIVGGE